MTVPPSEERRREERRCLFDIGTSIYQPYRPRTGLLTLTLTYKCDGDNVALASGVVRFAAGGENGTGKEEDIIPS